MSVRGRMTMRAVQKRAPAVAADPWGQEAIAAQTFHVVDGQLPCWVWQQERSHITSSDKRAYVAEIRGQFPVKADLSEQDQISDVRDRSGNRVQSFRGTLRINVIIPHRDHLEAIMERVDSGA